MKMLVGFLILGLFLVSEIVLAKTQNFGNKGDVIVTKRGIPEIKMGSESCINETETTNGKTTSIYSRCENPSKFGNDCVAEWVSGKAYFTIRSIVFDMSDHMTTEEIEVFKDVKISESEYLKSAQNWMTQFCRADHLPKPKVTVEKLESDYEVPFLFSNSAINNCQTSTETRNGNPVEMTTTCILRFSKPEVKNQVIHFCMIKSEVKGPNGPFKAHFGSLKQCSYGPDLDVDTMREVLQFSAKNRAELAAKTAELLQTHCQDTITATAEKPGDWGEAAYDSTMCPAAP